MKGIATEISRITASTFEELGFLLATWEFDRRQAELAPEATAVVRFIGSVNGAVEVRLSGSVLSELTENMLGEQAVGSALLESDALGELANVICGGIVPLLADSDAVFDLDRPRITMGTETPLPERAGPPAANVSLGVGSIGGGRVDVTLYLENEHGRGGEI